MCEAKTVDPVAAGIQLGAAKCLPLQIVNPDGFVTTVSHDGLALTLLFNGKLSVELKSGSGPDTAVAAAVFSIPVTVPAPNDTDFRGFAAFLQGFVAKGGGARVSLAMDLGGTARAVEFPYGKPLNEEFRVDLFNFEGLTIEPSDEEGTHQGRRLPPPSNYTASLIITVQRRLAEESVFLELQSLDLAVVEPSYRQSSSDPAEDACNRPARQPAI